MGKLQIDILGTSFAIQADEDNAYLKKLLKYYSQMTDEIEKGCSLKDSLQISILAGIFVCDELYKEKLISAKNKGWETPGEEFECEQLTLKMIKQLDKALE